jgi:hypothetical protein
VSEWCSDPIFRRLCDEMLFDPLPPDIDPLDLTTPSSRPDGSWCEDRDPQSLTDNDGRE